MLIVPPLTVNTRRRHETNFIDWLPEPRGVLAWLRGDDGIVGWGAAASFHPIGPERFTEAHRWWEDLSVNALVDDTSGVRSAGPIALVRMAYSDDSDESVVTVPKVLLGRRKGDQWTTTVADSSGLLIRQMPHRSSPMTAPSGLRYRPGFVSSHDHQAAVAAAIARIRAGPLEKVVLARDLIADSSTVLDERWILRRLSTLFPTCWVFAVNGLLGASPELLLQLEQDRFEILVLAGTTWPGDDRHDADTLLTSSKNRAEHAMAVESVIKTLRPLSSQLYAPPTPSVLRLPNVHHLATRVHGRLSSPRPGPLVLLGQLHPTAAVCGSPHHAAQETIRDLEKMDRGGYLGPVGWVDANGNAEFAIALRCAQVGVMSARLLAGGGIVAASTPEQEDAEVEAKLNAFRSALSTPDQRPIGLI